MSAGVKSSVILPATFLAELCITFKTIELKLR